MKDSAEAAKQEVAECEKEISAIKAQLRSLGPATDEGAGNTLQVSYTKIEGLPETAKPKLTLQLSSPIEEATLTEQTSVATFRGVETNQATLVVTALDADIPLGTSEPCDLAPMTKMDAMNPQSEYENTTTIEIKPDQADADTICTVTLRLVYKPSAKDQREELYEMLNKTSQRKAAAVQKLRQSALSASRSQVVTTSSGKPAVKPGFLNKSKQQDEKPTFMAWYERTLGPNSRLRKNAMIAKNYFIFFTVVTLFHFKGQELALPSPV